MRRSVIQNQQAEIPAADWKADWFLAELNDYPGPWLSRPGLPSEEVRDETRAKRRALLKECAKDWLQSGFDQDEIEEPYKRCLYTFERKSPASTLLWNWIKANPRRIVLTPSGEISLDLSHPIEAETRSDAAQVNAAVVSHLLHLMSSPLKWKLSQCASCARFYFREKPRELYKRPTYCAECRRGATAMRRTKEKRDAENDLLWQRAECAWAEWQQLSDKKQREFAGKMVDFIAGRIADLGKTRKWVSRNLKAIEKRMESQPKGK